MPAPNDDDPNEERRPLITHVAATRPSSDEDDSSLAFIPRAFIRGNIAGLILFIPTGVNIIWKSGLAYYAGYQAGFTHGYKCTGHIDPVNDSECRYSIDMCQEYFVDGVKGSNNRMSPGAAGAGTFFTGVVVLAGSCVIQAGTLCCIGCTGMGRRINPIVLELGIVGLNTLLLAGLAAGFERCFPTDAEAFGIYEGCWNGSGEKSYENPDPDPGAGGFFSKSAKCSYENPSAPLKDRIPIVATCDYAYSSSWTSSWFSQLNAPTIQLAEGCAYWGCVLGIVATKAAIRKTKDGLKYFGFFGGASGGDDPGAQPVVGEGRSHVLPLRNSRG